MSYILIHSCERHMCQQATASSRFEMAYDIGSSYRG